MVRLSSDRVSDSFLRWGIETVEDQHGPQEEMYVRVYSSNKSNLIKQAFIDPLTWTLVWNEQHEPKTVPADHAVSYLGRYRVVECGW